MNKMFTAVAVLQLVEKGKIKLHAPLNKYLDDSWIPWSLSKHITIEQILTMTSGLGSYIDGVENHPRKNETLDDYKTVMHVQTLQAQPGEKFVYSDTGFFLLGAVIQQVTGQDYYDYIRQHIYAPAGMSSCDSYELGKSSNKLAVGYRFSGGSNPWRENSDWIPLKGAPDGGGYATVGDLFRFGEALKSAKLVTSQSLKLLWTDHAPDDWGMGFDVYRGPAGRIVGKDGAGPGISGEMDMYLDKGYIVVALANQSGAAKPPLEAMRAEIAAAPDPR